VFGGGRSQVGFGDQHPAPRRRRRRPLPAEASNGICPHLRLTPDGPAGCLGGLARWNGQCGGYGTAGTMPTTTRRSGPCALRTGPAGLDGVSPPHWCFSRRDAARGSRFRGCGPRPRSRQPRHAGGGGGGPNADGGPRWRAGRVMPHATAAAITRRPNPNRTKLGMMTLITAHGVTRTRVSWPGRVGATKAYCGCG
jgi:hypothetical protein